MLNLVSILILSNNALFFIYILLSVAVIIMLYATDDMTIEEPNLRFTLVGTAFFVVGLLGASARFKTSRPDD